MFYSLDRIEDNIAVFILENKEIKTDIKNVLPMAKESYLYLLENGKFILSEEESAKVKNKNFNRLKKLIK